MKRIQTPLTLTLLVSWLLAACATTPTPAPTPVTPSVIVAQGRLQPQVYTDLSFSLSGQIAEVLVAEGQAVTAGQVLARLAASPDQPAQLARAELELLSAQQALATLQAAADANQAKAALTLLQAQAQLELSEDRLAELLEATNETATEVKPTELEIETAQALVTVAEVQVAEAQATHDILKDNAGLDPDLLTLAEARLATAQAARQALQEAQSLLELTAPLAGTVADVRLKIGERVALGQFVVSIADFSGWVVQTDDLTELEVVDVTIGQRARISLDALPDLMLEGTVIGIETKFEEKRGDITYTVTLAVPQADGQMRWGMTAAVTFDR